MFQPLAIVGASTRSAAASAARAGFQPLAADLFADVDLRRIATATRISPYPAGLADWLRAVEPQAWMYTGALENHPDLVDEMAWIAPLWGNSGDVLARVRSPWELSRVLGAADLLFPEIRESPNRLPLDGSWLVKTYRGASGSGVRVWGETGRPGDKETWRHPEADNSLESPYLVYQKRIAGSPCGVTFVAADGVAQLLGITRGLIGESWLGAHGFQYAGSIGPWPVSDNTRAALARLGNVLAAEFELVGLFNADIVLDGEVAWVLEVNPRYTASTEIVERFSGLNAIEKHAAACRGRGLNELGGDTTREKAAACGKAILYARRDLVVSRQFAEWSLAEATREPWPTLGDVSPAGTPIDAGRPILTVFAGGSDADEVEQQLRERTAALFKQLEV
jgi:predicted ATP-grasp superfamily ATP-dependent carboligase